MTEKRLVECKDCGYRWESTASNPRCSKVDCGRSRNVEAVDDVGDDEQTDETPQQPARADGGEDEADDPDDDEDDDSGGYTPGFEASVERTDNDRRRPAAADDEDDEQDDEDDDEASDGPEAADVPDIDPEQLAPSIASAFEMAAWKRGEHWSLDEDEAGMLAEAWCPVVNHYAPALMRPEHVMMLLACSTTVTMLKPRLEEDRRLKQQDEQAEQAARDRETGTVREATTATSGLDLDGEPDEQDEQTAATENDAAIGGFARV